MSLAYELFRVNGIGWAVATLGELREGGWFCTLYPAILGREVWSNINEGKTEDGYRVVSPRITGHGDTHVQAVCEAISKVLASEDYIRYSRLEVAIIENRNAQVQAFLRKVGRTEDGGSSEEGRLDSS